MLEIEVEYDKTSGVAVNVKWNLTNESKQPEVNNSVKSNQKQQNHTEQQSSQKSEAQVPTHNVEIHDQPFHTQTDYIFPKLKSGYKVRPCQAHLFKHFPCPRYDEK